MAGKKLRLFLPIAPLRFTHGQVAFDACHVRGTLAAVARRLRG